MLEAVGSVRVRDGSLRPRKHKDLSSIPRMHVRMPRVTVCSCNLRAGEAEIGGSWDLLASQPGLLGEDQISEHKATGY